MIKFAIFMLISSSAFGMSYNQLEEVSRMFVTYSCVAEEIALEKSCIFTDETAELIRERNEAHPGICDEISDLKHRADSEVMDYQTNARAEFAAQPGFVCK
jgi:hypothetical protein